MGWDILIVDDNGIIFMSSCMDFWFCMLVLLFDMIIDEIDVI